MPHWCRRLLALVLAAGLCMSTLCAQADTKSIQSAQRTVRLYPQHMQGTYVNQCHELCYIPLKVTAKNSTMCTSGCMIWAFAHAIQWCRQERYGSTKCLQLVQEFIAADPAPWDVLYVIDENYHNVVRNQGLEVLDTAPVTEAELINFFQDIGAVVCNIDGHCVTAIGYSYFDCNDDGVEDMMLHMLDSALWSSARKTQIYHFKTHKRLTFTDDCAGEFWMPQSTYMSLDHLAIVPTEETRAAFTQADTED